MRAFASRVAKRIPWAFMAYTFFYKRWFYIPCFVVVFYECLFLFFLAGAKSFMNVKLKLIHSLFVQAEHYLLEWWYKIKISNCSPFNGMLCHSLATLEGEQEFLDLYRASFPLMLPFLFMYWLDGCMKHLRISKFALPPKPPRLDIQLP